MTGSLSRRDLLAAGALAALVGRSAVARPALKNAFEISLAQWSYHKAFGGQKGVEKLDPLQFAAIAKKVHGIEAIEYVNQFYKAKKKDDGFLKDLKKVADDNGVT
jgi:L-ribulose-5-phosphate 3-epimerase